MRRGRSAGGGRLFGRFLLHQSVAVRGNADPKPRAKALLQHHFPPRSKRTRNEKKEKEKLTEIRPPRNPPLLPTRIHPAASPPLTRTPIQPINLLRDVSQRLRRIVQPVVFPQLGVQLR